MVSTLCCCLLLAALHTRSTRLAIPFLLAHTALALALPALAVYILISQAVLPGNNISSLGLVRARWRDVELLTADSAQGVPGVLLGAGCWLGMVVCLAARWYRSTRSTRLLVRVTSSFRRHSRHLHSSQVGRVVAVFTELSLYIACSPAWGAGWTRRCG